MSPELKTFGQYGTHRIGNIVCGQTEVLVEHAGRCRFTVTVKSKDGIAAVFPPEIGDTRLDGDCAPTRHIKERVVFGSGAERAGMSVDRGIGCALS